MWRDVLVVVFFLWLAVSVVILLARLSRRGRTSPDAAAGGAAAAGSRLPRPRAAEVEEEDDLRPQPAGEGPLRPSPDSPRPVPGASPPAATRSADQVIGPEANRAPVSPEQPLATLLAGIELPCGLLPHVGPDHPDPEHYVSLITTEASGAEVAGALTDELERLGYEVFALTEDDLAARRGDDLLSVRVHPRADVAQAGGAVLFPDAPSSATAVELWSGGGPSPRHP